MTEKIARWAFGTATARVSGDTARFMNVAVKSGIVPLKIDRQGESLLLTVRAKQYRRLHAVKVRTHARVRLIGRRGWPFVLRRALRRPGLLLGAVLGIALYGWLSGFYWGVTVEGEAPYAESEILEAAEDCGAYVGASRAALDEALASSRLQLALPKISWASMNTDGCFITLSVRGAVERDPGADHSGAYDIVAKRAGLVRSVTAESGTVLAEVGSAVAEGEVLVSGITEIGDPYSEEPVRHLLSHARAKVMAETRHTFTASCPLTLESKRETDTGTRRALYVLGVRVPLGLSGAPDSEITAYSREPLTLLGTALPVWVETLRTAAYEPVTVALTEEQAQQRAYEKIRQMQEIYLGEEGVLLSETVTYSLKDGVVYVFSECVCEENIAEAVPISSGT
ncbi:MAG: sporulation protein YqfD [Acutalibacteraceae bacterium]